MTSCVLVTEEIAEPGEGATICAISLALPALSACSPRESVASDVFLMWPMMHLQTSCVAGLSAAAARRFVKAAVSIFDLGAAMAWAGPAERIWPKVIVPIGR